MNLNQLLDLLPEMEETITKGGNFFKGGTYFELRKQKSKGKTEWVCARVSLVGNKEIANNIGSSPQVAVTKMLQRLGIKIKPKTGEKVYRVTEPNENREFLVKAKSEKNALLNYMELQSVEPHWFAENEEDHEVELMPGMSMRGKIREVTKR